MPPFLSSPLPGENPPCPSGTGYCAPPWARGLAPAAGCRGSWGWPGSGPGGRSARYEGCCWRGGLGGGKGGKPCPGSCEQPGRDPGRPGTSRLWRQALLGTCWALAPRPLAPGAVGVQKNPNQTIKKTEPSYSWSFERRSPEGACCVGGLGSLGIPAFTLE